MSTVRRVVVFADWPGVPLLLEVVQDHGGQQLHGLPMLLRRDLNEFRFGQSELRQRQPTPAPVAESARIGERAATAEHSAWRFDVSPGIE